MPPILSSIPQTEADLYDAYIQARKAGRRYVAELNNQGKTGYLPLLDEAAGELCSELSMGLVEVPLKKVIGTYSAGRQAALAGNFMPLLSADSEFAGKWRNVLKAHTNEGLRDPIKVFEYMGYYYVREGNKRVSVLQSVGAYSYSAEVIRLLPPVDSPEEDVRVFYELIGDNRRKPIGHLWFTRSGLYTRLTQAAQKAAALHPDWPEDFLLDSFYHFRKAYHSSGYTDLPLTTGDAFSEYVQVFGFPVGLSERELRANLRNCEPQFTPDEKIESVVVGDPDELRRPALFSFLSKPSKLSVAMVFAGTPGTRYMAAMHDVGRLAVQRELPGVTLRGFHAEPMAANAYQIMTDAVRSARPDILFSTDPYMHTAALRVALEQKNTLVLQCSASCRHKNLNTYYANTEQAAFLCGAMAAAVSASGKIGFIPGRTVTGTRPSDLQAFAQGAHFTRPHVRVFSCELPEQTPQERKAACRRMAERGCDYVWLPLLPDTPLEFKHFPGVYAHVCGLSALGYPNRRLLTAAWHWDVFYLRILRSILDTGAEPDELLTHYRMGLGTGLIDVHPVYPTLNIWADSLFTTLHRLLSEGFLDPLNESMTVETMSVDS